MYPARWISRCCGWQWCIWHCWPCGGCAPGAAAWHEAYLTHRAKYRPAVLVLGCMLCLLAAAAPFADARNSGVATSFYNVENWDGESRITFTQHISDWQNDSAAQYGALAHNLLNGRLDLQRDPPAAMAEMQNPYDTAARQSAAPDALWDVAYYQGRYYVYFGIVPCLLFQLPFELLTGVPDLPPSLAMIVMAWLLILAVFGLVRQAAQRWFPSASAAACLLAAAGIAGGSQVYYLLLRPRCMNTPSCAARHLCCWPCGSGCAPPTPRCSTMAKSCCTWRLAACAWRWWRDAAPDGVVCRALPADLLAAVYPAKTLAQQAGNNRSHRLCSAGYSGSPGADGLQCRAVRLAV